MAKLAFITIALLLVSGIAVEVAANNTTTTTTTTTPTTTTTTPTTTTTTTPTTTTTTTATPTTTTTTTPTTTSTTTPTTTSTTTPTTTSSTTTSSTSTTTPTTTSSTSTTSTSATTSTTTSGSTTTTAGSTTTTSMGSTTTTQPSEEHVYTITEKNVTCMQFEGNLQFTVNYTAGNETRKVNISTDDRPLSAYTLKGNCGISQSMTIQWGQNENLSNITLDFYTDNKTWTLSSIEASLFMDPQIFKGADDANSTLALVATFKLLPSSVALNKSFSCKNSFTAKNVTGSIADKSYEPPLMAYMTGKVIQFQAYNKKIDSSIQGGSRFVEAVECTTRVSSVVPIVVGCVLGGMVVLVLIAYIVGRNRHSAKSFHVPSNESNA